MDWKSSNLNSSPKNLSIETNTDQNLKIFGIYMEAYLQ